MEHSKTSRPLEHLPEVNSQEVPSHPRDKKEFAFPPLDIVGVSSEEGLFVPRLEVQPSLIQFRVIIKAKQIPKLGEGHKIFKCSSQRHCTDDTLPCVGDELSRADIVK